MGGPRVSRMAEDYLKIFWNAQEWPDGSVSTNEIAESLAVTPSSVSANLKKLARDGLIDHEPYGSISLTASGREIALMVVRRHRVLETYLVERLGLYAQGKLWRASWGSPRFAHARCRRVRRV